MSNKAHEEAKARLAALIAEKSTTLEDIARLETELAAKKQRVTELSKGWHYCGEIEIAKLDARDAEFPILSARREFGDRVSYRRVVDLDERWIGVRDDRADKTEYYSRETGLRKGSNPKAHFPDKIDAAKALEVWFASDCAAELEVSK